MLDFFLACPIKFYLANCANTLWKASTVFAICSSVCAVEINNPSNCDGGRKIPSSAIKRKYSANKAKSDDLAVAKSMTYSFVKKQPLIEPA